MSEVPDIPDAMVEAALKAYRGDELSVMGMKNALRAAIAAAPPEWLLRAALTEEELDAAVGLIVVDSEGNPDDYLASLLSKLSRALRGGEEGPPMTSDEELDEFHRRWTPDEHDVMNRAGRPLRGGEETPDA